MGQIWDAVLEYDRQVAAAKQEHTGIATQLDLLGRLTPRERLTRYLDTWVGMSEATWSEANVKALYEDILDVFKDHPDADTWFRAWRADHPTAC